MYTIIGGDQKEYGPVTAEQLRRWIAEGRVNGQTSVQAEGTTEWKPLAAFPEFADAFAAKPAGPAGLPRLPRAQPGLAEDIFGRDYDLDIGRCVSRDAGRWSSDNFGTDLRRGRHLHAGPIGFGLLVQIPIVGILVSLGSLIV